MATIKWAEKNPGRPRTSRVELTKSDGNIFILQSEYTNHNNNTTIPGDCINVTSSSKPNEPYIGNVVAFRFKGQNGPPESIFWRRWRGTEWGSQYELNPSDFDKISKVDCPVFTPEQGGKRQNRKSRKRNSRANRQSRRRQ